AGRVDPRRDPTAATLDRLLRATGHRLACVPVEDETTGTIVELRRRRDEIVSLLASGGVHHPRVFGSVARGDDGPDSDIDLIVDVGPDVSLIRLIGLERELSGLLGRPVDLVPADSLKPDVRVVADVESVPL
ncbi:MAG: nucleotidyltransferase family protein, partial [Acidimicrobiia bacterium]